MATTQKFVADVTINSRPAINNLDKLEKAVKNLGKEAKRQKKEGDLIGAQQTKQKMEDLNKVIAMTKHQVKDISNAFNTSGKSVAGLENALKLATEEWRRLTNEADRNKMAMRIRAIKDEINRMNASLDTTETKSRHAFGALAQRAAEYTGFYMLFNRSRQIITNAIQGNLKLSDSISDIQKVSGLSEEAVKGLVTQIEQIDSRNAPEVLNNMAYAAGKLGIKGSENLLGFTRAADKLNVALKEYLGDGADGVVRLMKFANVMGTTDQLGVEQALLKTGSALNYMTQSTAAAADYMIDFAGRFGPIARQARMTSGDVIGLASALDALTVNNEEAATSLQKFVVKLLSAPTQVSKALGLNAQVSKEMVETGKSIELVEMALGKLGERAEKYGVSGIASVIGDIGSKGQAQRLIKTLATLSNNTEMVANYVTMANDAFEKGTSVIDEYNIKNQNAAAIMERAKNAWTKMMVNAEEVGLVKELAQEFYDLSISLQNSTVWMTSLKAAFYGLVKIVEGLLVILPGLLTGLATFGASKMIVGIMGMVRSLGALYTALVAGTNGWRAFNLAMKSNAIGMAVSILVTLVAVVWQIVEATQEAARKSQEFNNKIKDLTTNLEDYNKELYKEQRAMDQLFAKAKAANTTTDERKRLIAEINVKYGKYLKDLLTEKSSLDDIAGAQREANQALRESIALRIKEGKLEEVRTAFAEKGASGLESFRAGVEKTGLSFSEIADAQQQVMDLLQKNYGKKGYTGPNQATVSILKELAKTDDRWNFVLSNRKDVGSIYDFMRESKKRGIDYYGNNPIDEGRRTAAYNKEREMVEANRRAYQGIYEYVSSIIEMNNAERKLNEKYDPLIGSLLNKMPEAEETNDNPTDVIEDFSKQQKELEEQQRKEFEEAKQQVASIKSQLTAFYEWRASEIEKMRDKNEITEATKDMMIEANKAAHAMSEMKAWQYMLNKEGAQEAWQDQLEVMRGEILKANPQMQELWDYISRVNLRGLGNTLQRLGTQEVGGLEKTIAQDADIVEKHAAKMTQTIQKELEKYDYIATVRTKFVNGLTQLGLLKTKFSEGEYGGESWKDEVDAANNAVDQLQSHYDELFDIDINTNEGVEKFRDILYQCTALSTEIVEGSVDSIRLLYEKTLEMGEEYTMALKRQTDKQKRIIDERWKRDPLNIQMQSAMKGQENEAKVMGAVSQKWGLATTEFTQDAEIQLFAMRLQAATDYYNKLKAEKADQRLLDEQEQKMMEATMALQEKMASKMTEMQQFFVDALNTLPDYGTALGEAFAKGDPKERADAFKEAHKEILKSLGEATKKMIIEWTKQRIQHAIQQQLMAQDTKQAGREQLSITTAAESAIANAQAAIGQQVLNTQQAQSQQSLATEASETQGKVALGIAGGAAKTIGELGWWGVPLVAVITAILNGLLAWALGSLFKGKSSNNPDISNKIKLVPGMLTYDEGNVGVVIGRAATTPIKGRGRFLGTDGKTYNAMPVPTPDGVALVNHPIATMIGGQPSLVAEKGQELIIGRRTLRDMTQFRPDLLQQIAMFERRRFRTYDDGNLGQMQTPQAPFVGSEGQNAAMSETLQQMQAVLVQLSQQLQNPIRATINKYGAGGLVDEVAEGLYTTKRRNNNINVRRLFGG